MKTHNILSYLVIFSLILLGCEKDEGEEPKACFTPSKTTAYQGESIDFTNCSTKAVSCFWEFGDEETSIHFNPSHSFTLSGSYEVKLTVFNGEFKNSIIQTITIEESPYPNACIELEGTTFQTGEDIQFTSCSSNSESYLWEFGDEETSTLENPTHSYSDPATYTVSLTVTNEFGSNTTNAEISVINSGVLLYDGFEDYSDFSLSFGDWTQIDNDGQPTWGVSGITFTNSGYSGSFIIFNPSQTTPPVNDEDRFLPHSGQKYAACFSSKNIANDDWLISPEITLGENNTLSLWVKSLSDEYGPDLFAIKLIENNVDIWITPEGTRIQPPTIWNNYTYSLASHSGKTVKVAIGCFSNDAFSMFVDDIEVINDEGKSILNLGFEDETSRGFNSNLPKRE